MRVVAGDVAGMQLVSDMEEVQYFQTLLAGYNRATGIGGHPRGRITVIHGPNQVGKSVLALALAESARLHGEVAVVFDTEYAAEKEWYNAITPMSGFKQPGDLDELFADVQKILDNLEAAKNAKRKADRLGEDVGCFFVVDTLTKLLPADILEKVEKEGIDKMYPIQALYISTWMKSIVPKLARTKSSMVLVLQERKAVGAMPNQKQYRPTGGEAIQYDNCVRVRVSHSKKVLKGKKTVGMQSMYTVENNKIDGTSHQEASFFTANGKGDVRKGLDFVREAIEEGKQSGHVRKVDGKDLFVLSLGEEKMVSIEGGWEHVRVRLMEDRATFDALFNAMAGTARRQP